MRVPISWESLNASRSTNHFPTSTFSLTKGSRCLVVNDAATGGAHRINPCVPSNLSDYQGSGPPIWAIVEEGSVLSRTVTDHQSALGTWNGQWRSLTN
jgi:hypothetical protein